MYLWLQSVASKQEPFAFSVEATMSLNSEVPTSNSRDDLSKLKSSESLAWMSGLFQSSIPDIPFRLRF